MSSGSDGDEFLTEAEFRAWSGALRFTNEAMRALDEALTANHRVSLREFDVLITLFNAPDNQLKMSQLAERVMLSPAGLTHLVTRLERDGLVRRRVDGGDRRSFFAALTREGHSRLRDARPTHNEIIREHLTRLLTAAQLRALGDLWPKVMTSDVQGTDAT